MSEKLVIECDHNHNNNYCLNKIDGFTAGLSERRVRELMKERGWIRTTDDSGYQVDYCPEHNKET